MAKYKLIKRYGTTTSRSHYGTLNNARKSAMASYKWVQYVPSFVVVYDANIGPGDAPNSKNTIGYVFKLNGRFVWGDHTMMATHYINKDGSVRKIKG